MKLTNNLPSNSNLVGPSPQKPIRNFFKVPSEGAYRLLEELAFNPPKTAQRKLRPFPPTRLSFVFAHDEDNNSENMENKPVEDAKNQANEASSLIYFAFNIGESVPLYHLKNPRAASTKEKPPMGFRVMPTCHDINKVTSTSKKLDVLLGFETGDVLVFEPLNKLYSLQYNKEPRMNTGRVHSVSWVPGSTTHFVAAFSNGIILFMDREREEPPATAASITKDYEGFSVTRQKNNKFNPVSKWHVSKKALNGMSFSPDGQYLAVACQDGYLRVFNYEEETLLVSFRSYYGGFLCVSWSPDGKYLVTGGEDDLISVWSLQERALLARGQGHRSWVSSVKFDPWVGVGSGTNTQSTTYRIGSVGEDTRLLLWDFEREVLRRPRMMSLSFSRSNSLTKHTATAPTTRNNNNSSQPPVPTFMPATAALPAVVDSKPRNEVPILQPLVEHRAHHEPVTDIVFLKDTIVTCCWGKVKFWMRPEEPSSLSSPSLPDPSPPAKDDGQISSNSSSNTGNVANESDNNSNPVTPTK